MIRGLKVLCLEMEDFSSGTSSRSTKLLWGGSRYLVQVFNLFVYLLIPILFGSHSGVGIRLLAQFRFSSIEKSAKYNH